MRVLAASACIAALAGCSDGGDSSSVPDTSPVVHIVSPVAGVSVACGEGRPGA